MFYGVYELDGEQHSGFYDDYGEWFKDTFCPDTDVKTIIDLRVHGKTYSERKGDVRSKALDFLDLFSVYGVNVSWGELASFQDYFETQGKRYGLLSEFRKNCVC